MTLETALRWSWMNVLNSKKRYDLLIENFGSLEKALGVLSLEMLRSLGVREETAMLAMTRLEEFDPDAYALELKKRGLSFLTFEDALYPEPLKEVPDAPIFLYWKGDSGLLTQPLIAIVGTREMSDYGKRAVSHLVPPIVTAGCVTVSGLAHGIDAEVARETMRAGGRTIAVLGHGLAAIYPKANERLAKEIIGSGGLILSEFPLDVHPDKYTFPARNRIIAGLSLGTIVVEATEDSGSLITADLALDYNRDVFAVPGQIFDSHFAGCHRIIARGEAKLITSAEDVLREIGIVSPTAAEERAITLESDDERMIFGTLTTMPVSIDDLGIKTKLDAATLSACLSVLEIRGIAKRVGGGQWVKG